MKSSITLVYRYVLLHKPGWMFKSPSDLIHVRYQGSLIYAGFSWKLQKVVLLCRYRCGVSKTQGWMITVCLEKS